MLLNMEDPAIAGMTTNASTGSGKTPNPKSNATQANAKFDALFGGGIPSQAGRKGSSNVGTRNLGKSGRDRAGSDIEETKVTGSVAN